MFSIFDLAEKSLIIIRDFSTSLRFAQNDNTLKTALFFKRRHAIHFRELVPIVQFYYHRDHIPMQISP